MGLHFTEFKAILEEEKLPTVILCEQLARKAGASKVVQNSSF